MCRERGCQRGVVAVEAALLLGLFMTVMFMALEVARAMYLFNTAQEITRRAARAAAVSDFSDAATMQRVRQQAIFRTTAGALLLADGIDDSSVRIDYLSLERNAGAANSHAPVPVAAGNLPACPLRNRVNCIANPYGATCVRLVRARLCQPGADSGACAPVPYTTMLPGLLSLFQGTNPPITMPTFDTVVVADSLGYLPGAPDCP